MDSAENVVEPLGYQGRTCCVCTQLALITVAYIASNSSADLRPLNVLTNPDNMLPFAQCTDGGLYASTSSVSKSSAARRGIEFEFTQTLSSRHQTDRRPRSPSRA
jgi:hypothetical protein